MKQVVLKLIRAYKKSNFLNNSFFRMFYISDSVCRFAPTCADYTYQAVEKYGVGKGAWLGFKRIIRCHPFSKGGLDQLK